MSGKIREEVVTSKRDPRREQTEPPPPNSKSESATSAETNKPTAKSTEEAAAESPQSSGSGSTSTSDKRLLELEPMLQHGDWNALLERLKEFGEPANLPPNLGLLWALARKELEDPDTPAAPEVNATAIACAATLLGAPKDSAIALVVAKRLLRKNPVSWRQAPAPSRGISALIVVGAITIGSGIGWLLANGYIVINLPGNEAPARMRSAAPAVNSSTAAPSIPNTAADAR